MGKLYEVLAVREDLAKSTEEIVKETKKLFSSKHEHFDGQSRKYTPIVERSAEGKEEAKSETFPDENKDIVTTVPDRLAYTEDKLARLIDLNYQLELTNTTAFADLVVDGVVLAEKLPATLLLNLEHKFSDFKKMVADAPTLEPGERWTKDTQQKHTWRSETKQSHRTNKTIKPLVLAHATDKFPAQVEKISVDERVGVWETTKYSGRLSAVQKVELLEKCDALLGAIKSARSRANSVDAQNVEIGKKLFKFLHV